jgi:ankyrin repeat protein
MANVGGIWDIITLEYPPPKVLEMLNEQVAGFNAVTWRDTKTGIGVLHMAVAAKRLKLMKLLLEKGCDVNAADRNGATPLYMACQYGRLDMVKVLMGYGADIHQASAQEVPMQVGFQVSNIMLDGITPLACALVHEQMDVFNYLLTQGARVTSTALAMAITKGLPIVQVRTLR